MKRKKKNTFTLQRRIETGYTKCVHPYPYGLDIATLEGALAQQMCVK